MRACVRFLLIRLLMLNGELYDGHDDDDDADDDDGCGVILVLFG